MEDTLTSGFVSGGIPSTGELNCLEEIYTSASGYNRLFRCERFGRIHVLKALKQNLAGSLFYEQALRKEFSIGYQLEHPHICRTLGWETVPQLGHCILMEYIDGYTLRDAMDRHIITAELAYKWIAELCDALQYLHSKQVIHRDLKPSNVLITHNGANCKLIDFSLSDCDDYDVLKLPAGTRYYLAPEMLQEGVTPDVRADIFSLGVIIGEIASVLSDRHLAAVSRKCTQHRRERRFASAAQVLAAVQHRSYWRRYGAVAAVLLALCIGVGVNLWERDFPKTATMAFPVYGNLATQGGCQRILAAERIRLMAVETAVVGQHELDSLLKCLKQALDTDYPLPVQRESAEYKRLWEMVKMEAERLFADRIRSAEIQ